MFWPFMSQAFPVAADAGSGVIWSQILPGLIAGAAAIAAGLVTQLGTFRTASRAAQTQRDHQLDERADKQFASATAENDRLMLRIKELESECTKMRADRDEYRERLVSLRVNVRAAGFDPETIGEPRRRTEQP